MSPTKQPSARETELLDAAYAYVLEHGMHDLSLRPLAAATGTSPRVLLFLFGSKDGLVRALLARARTDELALFHGDADLAEHPDLASATTATWAWLRRAEHRGLLRLWAEAYARSLLEPDGPWSGFAAETVSDWLALLAAAGGEQHPDRSTQVTLTLAVLRGCLLDLLATGETARTDAAVALHVASLTGVPRRA